MGTRLNWERVRKETGTSRRTGTTAPSEEEKVRPQIDVERAARIERNVRRRLGKG